MKFLIKKPNGPAYELTRAQMNDTDVVRQLSIDETWKVRVGSEWISLPDFLGMPASRVQEVIGLASKCATDSALEPDASWTPATVISVIVRLWGIYFLYLFASGVVAGISICFFASRELSRLPGGAVLAALFLHTCYLVAGIYLASGARSPIRWAFRPSGAQ